jgi:hypothetical protein
MHLPHFRHAGIRCSATTIAVLKRKLARDMTDYEQLPGLTRYPQAGGFSEPPGDANRHKVQSRIVTTLLLHVDRKKCKLLKRLQPDIPEW